MSVAICVGPLVLDLGRPDTIDPGEQQLLVSVREALAHYHVNGAREWLVPTVNGVEHNRRPPLPMWATMIGCIDLAGKDISGQTLIWRARLVGLVMVLLALAGTFWIGMSLGDLRVATLSVLITGTMFILIRQGHVAAAHTHLLAWVMLSVASGLWAMRPLKPINRVGRRVFGWLLAGGALGLAIMTGGPLGLIAVLLPLSLTIIISQHRRVGNAIGLLFALSLGLILAGTWYLYVLESELEQVWTFFGRWPVLGTVDHPTWQYLIVAGLPWSIFLIGSWFQPFLPAGSGRRRALLIGWLWFGGMVGLVWLPLTEHFDDLVLAAPVAGLMIAQLWSYHALLASEGRVDVGAWILSIPHWLLMLALSMGLPMLMVHPEQAARFGYPPDWPLPEPVVWPVAWALGVVLLILVGVGARWHWQWRPTPAVLTTTLWALVAAAAGFYAYARCDDARFGRRGDVEAVTQAVDGRQLVHFVKDQPLGEGFVFYVRRVVLRVDETSLDDMFHQRPRPATCIVIHPNAQDAEGRRLVSKYALQPLRAEDGSPLRFRDAPGDGRLRHVYHWPRDAATTGAVDQ